MSIERADFDAMSENDLQQLVVGQVPEGLRLEYKRAAYGASDADKRELLKDVSALANASGGHLIIGLAESDGVAVRLVGLDAAGIDSELLRMENLVRSGIEPRISGLRMRQIALANGRQVIMIRIPRSWNSPHRVIAQGSNRFYLRHSAGVHEPSMEELRAMFTAGESAMVRAAAFRDSRLSSLSMDELQIPADFRGAMVIHVIPMVAMSGRVRIDPEAARREQDLLRPIDPSAYGYSPEINFDGFLNRTTSGTGVAQTQVFRDGCIESIISGIVWRKDDFQFISAKRIERSIFEFGLDFFPALQNLGVEPPIAVFVSLLDVKGARYNVNKDCFEATGPTLPRARLTVPPCVVNDYGDAASYRRSLAFIADCLWNSAGKAKAQWINADGDWQPPEWAKR